MATPQLTEADLARVKAFLDQISPAPARKLTVQESGVGGPGINIPLTPQTDRANFPPWQMREYPKMLTKIATPDDASLWIKGHKPEDGHPVIREGDLIPVYATQKHVRLGFAKVAGDPIIIDSKDQEDEFFGLYPEHAKPVEIPVLGDDGGSVAVLGHKPTTMRNVRSDGDDTASVIEAENARLRELIAEQRKLKAELQGLKHTPVKRRGRRKAKKAAPPRKTGPKSFAEFANEQG